MPGTTKTIKPPKSAAQDKPESAAQAIKEEPASGELGIDERRHFIRPLPVPDAVESDGDTDWDTFQILNSEQPKD
jgi:hypothetical protein